MMQMKRRFKLKTRWWQGSGIAAGAGEPQMGPDVGVRKSHCALSAEPHAYKAAVSLLNLFYSATKIILSIVNYFRCF